MVFTEDVQKRMEAFGFQTITVDDGNDLQAIGAAIEAARSDRMRPSFITVKTKIGWGCPAKEGKASAHGEPLGKDNVTALKVNLGWDNLEAFYVPQEVYDHCGELAKEGGKKEGKWNAIFCEYKKAYPDLASLWERYHDKEAGKKAFDDPEYWAFDQKPEATRNLSGMVINRLKDMVPSMVGGAADLSPSTKTYMKGGGFSQVRLYRKEPPFWGPGAGHGGSGIQLLKKAGKKIKIERKEGEIHRQRRDGNEHGFFT